ncbi:MAG: hypothetical protein ABJC12_06595 [Saprospiraceae bacterium]
MQQDILFETDEMTPAMLLPIFYAKNNLGMDGGNGSPVVKIDISKRFHFYIPNYDARRRAVLWHDIHHLVTGYSAATFIGECEISAWEIASGCGKYWAAFIIDTSGVALGIFMNPVKIIKAYARGRRSSNLYHDSYTQDEVMDMPIAKLRAAFGMKSSVKEIKVRVSDLFHLAMFLIFAGVYSVISILQIPFLLVFNIWYAIKLKAE